MIIYGYRNRNVEIGTGQFICPKCDTDRTYKHINVVRYFTLFFIQLFPLGKLASYIECQTCMRAFKPEEMAGTRGNERMVADMAARKAAADLATQGVRGRNLIVIGGIIAAISLCLLAILGAFALTNTSDTLENNIVTALIFGAICPLPLLALAAGLGWWGIRTRQAFNKASANAAQVMA
jgi:hypothetical protein